MMSTERFAVLAGFLVPRDAETAFLLSNQKLTIDGHRPINRSGFLRGFRWARWTQQVRRAWGSCESGAPLYVTTAWGRWCFRRSLKEAIELAADNRSPQ